MGTSMNKMLFLKRESEDIMDLDNINDLEKLRKICKMFMLQMKKDYIYKDPFGEEPDYIFKKGHWYFYTKTEYGVDLYMEDNDGYETFTYAGIKEYCNCENTDLPI